MSIPAIPAVPVIRPVVEMLCCGKWELWEYCSRWSRALSFPLLQSMLAMDFDTRSFCKFMNEQGRAYQYRAMELVKICRLFAVTLEQSPHQLAKFQR